MERNGELFEMTRRKKLWDLEMGKGGLTEQKGVKITVEKCSENITVRCLLVYISLLMPGFPYALTKHTYYFYLGSS